MMKPELPVRPWRTSSTTDWSRICTSSQRQASGRLEDGQGTQYLTFAGKSKGVWTCNKKTSRLPTARLLETGAELLMSFEQPNVEDAQLVEMKLRGMGKKPKLQLRSPGCADDTYLDFINNFDSPGSVPYVEFRTNIRSQIDYFLGNLPDLFWFCFWLILVRTDANI